MHTHGKHMHALGSASLGAQGHTWLPGITPPQKATSVQYCPRAASRFAARLSTVVVGGIELSGMSTRAVTPPDAAARVPVQKPSQSVRPGSFRWTCALVRMSAWVLIVQSKRQEE